MLVLRQAAYDKVRKAKKQAAERTQKLDEKRKKVKLGNKMNASFSLGLKSSLAGSLHFFCRWNSPLVNLLCVCDGCGLFMPVQQLPDISSHSRSWGWSCSGRRQGVADC